MKARYLVLSFLNPFFYLGCIYGLACIAFKGGVETVNLFFME